MRMRTVTLAAIVAAAALALPSASSAAEPKAAWWLNAIPMPANFLPGKTSEYLITATNVGAAPTSGTVTFEAQLPPGLKPVAVGAANSNREAVSQPTCGIEIATQTVECEAAEVASGQLLTVQIKVEVESPPAPAEGELTTQVSVKGGGAAEARREVPTKIAPDPVPFSILPGFAAPASQADGSPATLAGSHPFQLTVDFAFPTEHVGSILLGNGHPRDVRVDLPRGLLGDPAASHVLCTEAQLTSGTCPDESQLGVVEVTTLLGAGVPAIANSNLYDMVPPPGAAAALATDVGGLGLFVHLQGGVRSDGDYGLYTEGNDLLAIANPIFTVRSQIWGDPSAAAHDGVRGRCLEHGGACEVTRRETAFLTLPGSCPPAPSPFEVHADSWEQPGLFKGAAYESADFAGSPAPTQGCEGLKFEPEVEAKPTTNLTDSPSGLDVTVRQPQDFDLKGGEGRASAELKDITLAFPAGTSVNPSQAGGLGACTESQVGYQPSGGQIHFSKAPAACPNEAKLGTVKVTSPLLVHRNAEHEVVEDPETQEPFPEPLKGSLYLAKPFENPFGSLAAVYLVIEDAQTGIVAKLAGRADLDPGTGQITTTFEENPQLPLQEVKAHLFGGPRGALITPPACGRYATASELAPWSGAPAAELESPFQLTASPAGPCPASQAQMPNAPKLDAGTISPRAGKYSPLLFRLSREDGSQRLGRIEATLPSGLSAKLAGVATCPEAAIARAKAREAPNQGAAELADPSCPSSSEVGVVDVGAGAGPTPYYTRGHAYLAGPYAGAPLSFVFIVPAVAGPFDLGTVVSRAAVRLDPETAQARAVTDPLPSIIDGIPVDVRSVALRLSRSQLTLNPTSCDVKSFGGTATSTLGAPAPLFERFQVGGCRSLPYKPRLSTRLFGPTHRGGHPRLRVVFTAKPGEANTARISLALPHSEFIDQAHFRTICTRVQFAADQCPAGSVYGHIRAITPLLAYPLEGPLYLRSSSHKLPDVVAALRGPPSQPLEFDLDGRVDSVHGGIRTTFEVVPDAPVTKAIVTLQGAQKGLFQNSTNICRGSFRATLKLSGQNGKVHEARPALKAKCPKASSDKP